MADAQPLSLPAALSPPPGSGNHAASAEHAIGGMNRSSSIHLHSVQRSGVEVYVWGAGDCGQLGDGTTVDSPHPHRIEALTGKDIATLSAGEFHTALSTLDGEVFIWGDNAEGQLGLRGAEASSVPSRVEALDNFKVQLVACGSGHTLAADDDGTTLAFGQSDYGQLGIGPVDLARVDRPKALKALKGTNVIAAAAGSRHSMLLDSAGVLYACGDGSFGALGLSATESSDVPRPVLKVWPLGVSQVAAGDSHSAALTLHGALFTWGRGRSGQLGLGDFQNVSTPTLVKALAGMHVAQVSCGGDHTLAASASGDAYSWGQGKWGATGLAHLDDTCSPQRLANLVGERVVQVSAGGRHSLLLTAVSEVWAVGCNDNGQVGGELGEAVLVPRRVAGLPAGHPVLSVVAGGSHSIAICQSGASGGSATAGSAASRPLGAEGLILQASNRRLMHPPALCPVLEAAVARGKEQPALIQPVVHAVERNFSNPGYLMHLFSRVHSSTGEVVLSDPLAPGAALDVPRIGETYQALLKLYDPLVATALGASSIKLLDSEFALQQLRSSACCCCCSFYCLCCKV